MKKLVLIVFLLIGASTSMIAQDWKTPVIEGYGRISHVEDVAISPDPAKEYKLLFYITSDKEREGVNAGLWKMARVINLLESGGVPTKQIHVASVVSGSASFISLSQETSLKRMGRSNPNLDLIQKLKEYGAVMHLGGQAAAEKGIDPKTELNPYFDLTLSALVDIPTYQMQGYVVMFF